MRPQYSPTEAAGIPPHLTYPSLPSLPIRLSGGLLAIRYNSLGITVLPANIGKKIVVDNWKHYSQRPQSREQIIALPFEKAHAIAAICGRASNDLMVIDFNEAYSGKSIHDFLGVLDLPSTYEWVVKTCSGLGYHIYVRCPGFSLSHSEASRSNALSGNDFDVAGVTLYYEGCYALLPESIAFSRRTLQNGRYTFVNTRFPSQPPRAVSSATLLAAFRYLPIFPRVGHHNQIALELMEGSHEH